MGKLLETTKEMYAKPDQLTRGTLRKLRLSGSWEEVAYFNVSDTADTSTT